MKQVYFLQTDTGVIKVGCTKNVYERIKTLRRDTKFDFDLCRVRDYPDEIALSIEKAIIKRFEKFRIWKVKREWFVPNDEITGFIKHTFPATNHVCTGEEWFVCCEHERGKHAEGLVDVCAKCLKK